MEDLLRELGQTFEQSGFLGVIGSLCVMIPLGIMFWLAARANEKGMDKDKK